MSRVPIALLPFLGIVVLLWLLWELWEHFFGSGLAERRMKEQIRFENESMKKDYDWLTDEDIADE